MERKRTLSRDRAQFPGGFSRSRSSRRVVAYGTSVSLAMARIDISGFCARSSRTCRRVLSSKRGRPTCFPSIRALAIPAFTRSDSRMPSWFASAASSPISAAPGGTRFLISIFLDQLPALVTIDEGAKLPALVLGFLPVGGDSRIEGDPSHGSQGTPFGSVSRGAEEAMKPGLRARHPADPFEPPSRQWYRTPDHYPLACVFVPLFPNPQVLECWPALVKHQYEHRAAQLRAGFDIGILQHLQAVSPALSEEKSNVRSTDFFWRPKRSSRVCWGGSGVLTSRHERARTQSCCSTARGTASECNTVRTADPGPALPNPLGIWHAADNRAAEPSFPCGWKGPHWFWWSSPPPTIESPTAVSRGWPYRGCELLRDENPPL